MRCYSSLLNAGDMNHKTGPNCRNIIIRGRGTICGGGQELARKIIEDERAASRAFWTTTGSSSKAARTATRSRAASVRGLSI